MARKAMLLSRAEPLHIEVESAAHIAERCSDRIRQGLEFSLAARPQLAGDDEFLVVVVEHRLVGGLTTGGHHCAPSSVISADSVSLPPPEQC